MYYRWIFDRYHCRTSLVTVFLRTSARFSCPLRTLSGISPFALDFSSFYLANQQTGGAVVTFIFCSVLVLLSVNYWSLAKAEEEANKASKVVHVGHTFKCSAIKIGKRGMIKIFYCWHSRHGLTPYGIVYNTHNFQLASLG